MKRQDKDASVELRAANDEELVGLVARRDEGALRELYHRYAPYLKAMIQRMPADLEAEKFVEDAFVRLWEGARRFDPIKAGARTWIVTSAHRLAINRLPTLRRAGDARLQGPAAFGVPRPIEEDGGGAEEAGAYVSEVLDRLDPLARRLLELAFFEGRNQHELVEASARSPATVKTTMRRALATLHEAVAGGGR